jgi:hypothetical protein
MHWLASCLRICCPWGRRLSRLAGHTLLPPPIHTSTPGPAPPPLPPFMRRADPLDLDVLVYTNASIEKEAEADGGPAACAAACRTLLGRLTDPERQRAVINIDGECMCGAEGAWGASGWVGGWVGVCVCGGGGPRAGG